MAGKG
jgi:hypothetical protein